MIKKPWTPDHCPLQAGMCIHDVRANVDVLVAIRYLDYDSNNTDEDKPLLELANGDRFTGRDLFEQPFTYYPDWPSTLEEKPCYDEVKEEPLYCVLTQDIFNAVCDSHFATEGKHYTVDEKGMRIWEDDLATIINNAAEDIAKAFKEFKHDEQ